MRRGELVETGATQDVFAAPQHEYTQMLLDAEPVGRPVPTRDDAPTILQTEGLRVWFPIKTGLLKRTTDHFKAVDGVDLSLRQGRSLGVVGESGSGKSTLGLAILRLIASRGSIRFEDRELQGLRRSEMRPLRREIQIVFQDPFGSLSPRMSVAEIVAEGLEVHGETDRAARDRLAAKALEEVGVDPGSRRRYPHEFSGGQRQRIAIARALVLQPRLLILDEPTSSLDRSVQFQVVALLKELQRSRGLSYLFITHDLKVVRSLCHDIIVMRGGKVVEAGPAERIFTRPDQEYTQALLKAAF